MSEEVAAAAGTIDYWKNRAISAEAAIVVLVAELAAARQVIDAARPGFGSSADLERAHAFDPRRLSLAIAAYDIALQATKEQGHDRS